MTIRIQCQQSKICRIEKTFILHNFSFFILARVVVNISSQEMQQFHFTFVQLLLNVAATTTGWAL